MPIDNAEKRRSVSGVCKHWKGPGLTVNVLKDQEWRQQAGRGYSGILSASPTLGQPTYLRTWGIVGGPGYKGRWNIMYERIKNILNPPKKRLIYVATFLIKEI